MDTLPLIPAQRQRRILELLQSHGVVSIHALTEELTVSPMTVRRDIARLQSSGQVDAVQGGVRLSARPVTQPPHDRGKRQSLETPHKRAIAAEAARFVEDGMVVFLDAGTTCEALVPHLRHHHGVTAVTNDAHSALALMALPNVATILAGGELDPVSAATGGRLAAATIAAINLDVAFISTGAWSLDRGVMAPALPNVDVKIAAMRASGSSVLVADSSKYGAIARFTVGRLDQFDAIVTDDALPDSELERLQELDVELREVTP